MALRIRFTNSNFGRALEAEINKANEPMTTAAVGALGDAAKLAVSQGRANIRSAGRFPSSWVTGLKSRVYKNKGLDAAALIYHRIAIAGVFEEGATIIGKPLMWLPIGGRRALARAARNVSFFTPPGGRPMAFGDVQGKRIPILVGIETARIRKRFNIAAIVRAAAAKLGEFYSNRMNKQ